MAIIDRESLKNNFEKGAMPTQQDFEDLVDSMFHKQDDGLISEDDGLKLSPKGSAAKMISFFNSLNDFKPTWGLEQYPRNTGEFGLNLVNGQGESKLFIQEGGNIGVGTMEPADKLTVSGNVSMQGRRGTYAAGKVPGDGNWHTIISSLNECSAFEVIAKVGKSGKGLYGMVHALAMSAFGKSNNTIQKTDAYYGSFRNKMDLRWTGDVFDYSLQIRSNRDYGEESMIKYYVTNLWWEDEE